MPVTGPLEPPPDAASAPSPASPTSTFIAPTSNQVLTPNNPNKCSGCQDSLDLDPTPILLGGSIGDVLLREANHSGRTGNVGHDNSQDGYDGDIVQDDRHGNSLDGLRSVHAPGEEGLCARCAEQRNAIARGSNAGMPDGTDPTGRGVLSSSRRDSPDRPSGPVPISSSTQHPAFVPSSYFPPGLIQSIPSTSSTAYTQILTPTPTFAGATIDPPTVIGETHPFESNPSPTPITYNPRLEDIPKSEPHRAGPSTIPTRSSYTEHLPNPLLDIGRLRRPSQGRGTLYPGSIFRGKQTSGRSSYEVEVRILDVDFTCSTLSGYLSISHLTDTHPKLTTFFSGEIIGPTYGFLTGTKYYAQATEQDDLRHWSRFDRFHQVRNELRRPGLTMSDKERGPTGERERGFVFMRWKERFLVPDHKVRDISGASFAGFYYLQLELEEPTPKGMASGGSAVTGAGARNRETVYLNGRPGARGTATGASSPGGSRTQSSTGTDQAGTRSSTMPALPPGVTPSTLPNSGTTSRPSVGERRRSSKKSDREAGNGSGVPVLKVSV